MWKLILALVIVCAGALSASAAEITYIGEIRRYQTLRLSGPIEAGDVAKIKKLRIPPGTDWSASMRLSLDSPGGSFVEAVKIANYVWDEGIGTLVDSGKICLSACAIIFMSGTGPWEDHYRAPDRNLHVRGRLGFHAPFINPERLGEIPSDKAAELALVAYKTALTAAVNFLALSHKAKWPSTLVEEILKVQDPNKFLEIDTIDKVGRWHIQLSGYRTSKFRRSMLPHICRSSFLWPLGLASADRNNNADFVGGSSREFRAKKKGRETLYYYEPEGMGSSCGVTVTPKTKGFDLTVKIAGSFKGVPPFGFFPPNTRLKDIPVATGRGAPAEGAGSTKAAVPSVLPPPPTGSCGAGYRTYEGIDYTYNDIGGYRVNLARCRKLCDARSNCRGFAFVTHRKRSIAMRCWLKHRMANRKSVSFVTSCIKL